jgi:hypothetical protein
MRLAQQMRITLAMGVAAAMLGGGCAARSVESVMANPSRYENRDVRVSGHVDDSYSVLSRGVYRITDGTGRLWVVSDNVPRRGSDVTVKGTIRSGVDLGFLGRLNIPADISSGLVLVEESHSVR